MRFPVTCPERTAYDLARSLPRLDAIAALDAMLHRRITTMDAIRAFAVLHPLLLGRPLVFDRLSLVDGRAESPMESIARVMIVDGGLPRPDCQVTVVNLRNPAAMLAQIRAALDARR